MGTLRDFNITQSNCDVFFETGTGNGYSLTYALTANCFKQFFSVEIHKETHEKISNQLANYNNLSIINSNSVTAMHEILPKIPISSSILFYLDAHFPGEFHQSTYDYKAETPLHLRLPLDLELAVIKQYRANAKDIIIIDDLRIYKNGPFAEGNMPAWAETLPPELKNIDFVKNTFPDAEVFEDYRSTGYLIIKT